MDNASTGPYTGGGKRGWTALLGTCVFLAGGVLLAMVASRETGAPAASPSAAADLHSDPGTSSRAAAAQAGSAGRADRAAARDEGGGAATPSAQLLGERAFDCMISPRDITKIGSAVPGVIQSVLVERGDYVDAGQVVVMLESSTERAALAVAQARAERSIDVDASEANLRLRERQRSRALALFQSASVSREARDQAETDARLADLEHQRAVEDRRLAALQLEQARVALERRMILSPVSGLVVERMMSRGEMVIDNDAILRIAEIDRLRVEVILPSQLYGQIHVGGSAQVTPEAPYDRARAAEVAIVDRIIDGASGTFGVRLTIPNPDHELPGGLRCQVRFP